MDKRSIKRIDRHIETSSSRASKRSVAAVFDRLSPEEKQRVVKEAKRAKRHG